MNEKVPPSRRVAGPLLFPENKDFLSNAITRGHDRTKNIHRTPNATADDATAHAQIPSCDSPNKQKEKSHVSSQSALKEVCFLKFPKLEKGGCGHHVGRKHIAWTIPFRKKGVCFSMKTHQIRQVDGEKMRNSKTRWGRGGVDGGCLLFFAAFLVGEENEE
ncbi:hypothetical protein JTE90_007799 [Oedothorax gibbosus]|uniref:Uncharacterized protein n=1 Tax=Oedothorax gibbosus TaxID=931172 RepID=A0AAV6VK78_9ARAC|nr:hypothetical protein JTE90_007799 [Oedothorax gibbosus]